MDLELRMLECFLNQKNGDLKGSTYAKELFYVLRFGCWDKFKYATKTAEVQKVFEQIKRVKRLRRGLHAKVTNNTLSEVEKLNKKIDEIAKEEFCEMLKYFKRQGWDKCDLNHESVLNHVGILEFIKKVEKDTEKRVEIVLETSPTATKNTTFVIKKVIENIEYISFYIETWNRYKDIKVINEQPITSDILVTIRKKLKYLCSFLTHIKK